jgi:hypothetical protein
LRIFPKHLMYEIKPRLWRCIYLDRRLWMPSKWNDGGTEGTGGQLSPPPSRFWPNYKQHLFHHKTFLRRSHKCAQLSSWFWRLLSKCQNHEDDFTHLCGLLRKAELY